MVARAGYRSRLLAAWRHPPSSGVTPRHLVVALSGEPSLFTGLHAPDIGPLSNMPFPIHRALAGIRWQAGLPVRQQLRERPGAARCMVRSQLPWKPGQFRGFLCVLAHKHASDFWTRPHWQGLAGTGTTKTALSRIFNEIDSRRATPILGHSRRQRQQLNSERLMRVRDFDGQDWRFCSRMVNQWRAPGQVAGRGDLLPGVADRGAVGAAGSVIALRGLVFAGLAGRRTDSCLPLPLGWEGDRPKAACPLPPPPSLYFLSRARPAQPSLTK